VWCDRVRSVKRWCACFCVCLSVSSDMGWLVFCAVCRSQWSPSLVFSVADAR